VPLYLTEDDVSELLDAGDAVPVIESADLTIGAEILRRARDRGVGREL
jgi:hypothetical protein